MQTKSTKILLSAILTLSLVICTFYSPQNAYAATKTKPKLSNKSVSVMVGYSQKITVKNNKKKKKVTWSSANASIATVKNGTITGIAVGKTTITATVSGKKLNCSVTVKSNAGTIKNPLNAYESHKLKVYSYSEYLGTFEIQLLDYKDGEDAEKLVMSNDDNTQPDAYHEYIYFKFSIKYIDGESEIEGSDIFNYHSNLYNSESNYNLNDEDWAYDFDSPDVEDIGHVSLYPGGSCICSKAILVKIGKTPATYRICTGYDNKKYEPIYTWFKVE